MRLSFVRVSTWNQAEILREVRNSCRSGMTHDTHEITVEEQRKFWADELLEGEKYECYLLLDDHTPVGYGLLKWDKELDRYWMTAGVTPEYRGRKLSRLLINFITEMGHREGREVWIDVYDDNFALIGDIRNGFEFVQSDVQPDGKILHLMRHNRDRILHPREAFKLIEKTGEKVFTTADLEDIATEMVEVDALVRARD
jgi:GNAT superfamily N-acetyltransferase